MWTSQTSELQYPKAYGGLVPDVGFLPVLTHREVQRGVHGSACRVRTSLMGACLVRSWIASYIVSMRV